MKRSPLKRTPMKRGKKGINRVSKRRQRVNHDYAKARVAYLGANSRCEISVDGCTGVATDIHHVRSRGRSGRDADLTDVQNLRASCRECHTFVEEHRQWALERGFLKKARTDAELEEERRG